MFEFFFFEREKKNSNKRESFDHDAPLRPPGGLSGCRWCVQAGEGGVGWTRAGEKKRTEKKGGDDSKVAAAERKQTTTTTSELNNSLSQPQLLPSKKKKRIKINKALVLSSSSSSSSFLSPVSADASTATSGPNAFAVALDPETGKIIGGGGGGGVQNKTGRRLSSSASSSHFRRSLLQDLSAATSGNGFAFSSGGGKSITAGSGAAPGGGGKSCDTATSGNAFAFVGGGGVFDWSTAGASSNKAKAAPPIYKACPGEVLTFYWNNPTAPVGLAQFAGPGCPSDFGKAAAEGKARVLVAPTQASTSYSVKLDKRGRYFFADPGLCKQGVVQEVEV